jgi:hypothetical protein
MPHIDLTEEGLREAYAHAGVRPCRGVWQVTEYDGTTLQCPLRLVYGSNKPLWISACYNIHSVCIESFINGWDVATSPATGCERCHTLGARLREKLQPRNFGWPDPAE